MEKARVARLDGLHELLCALISLGSWAFVIVGAVMLWGAWKNDEFLIQPDAVLAMTNRSVMMIAGLWHLLLGCTIYLCRSVTKQSLLFLYAVCLHAFYWVGLWTKAVRPSPLVNSMAWKFHLAPAVLNWIWQVLVVGLFIGSCLSLAFERRYLKERDKADFEENYLKQKEAFLAASTRPHHSPALKGGGRESEVAELKISCLYCGQYIICASTHSGSQVFCPNCHQQITIPEFSANKQKEE